MRHLAVELKGAPARMHSPAQNTAHQTCSPRTPPHLCPRDPSCGKVPAPGAACRCRWHRSVSHNSKHPGRQTPVSQAQERTARTRTDNVEASKLLLRCGVGLQHDGQQLAAPNQTAHTQTHTTQHSAPVTVLHASCRGYRDSAPAVQLVSIERGVAQAVQEVHQDVRLLTQLPGQRRLWPHCRHTQTHAMRDTA